MQWHHWWWLKGMPMALTLLWSLSSYWLTEGRQQAACEYTAISEKAVGEIGERRMSNGSCTTERNCGYAIWYAKFHKLRSPCVKMNTPTMNVCLRVLDSKDKRNSRIFQLKDVPRFLVWTAYCLRLYIASHKKFRNIALNCCFRLKSLQLNAEEHGQTI